MKLLKSSLLAVVLLILLTICLVFGVIDPACTEDASVVRATQVDGTVVRNGSPLKEGDIIQRDDKIETAGNSLAVLTWSNGSIVQIYPGSSLILKGVTYEGDKKMEKTLIALQKGRIFAKAQVPEHLFSHFEISIGNVAILSQGAEYAVKHDEEKKQLSIWSLIGTVIVDMGVNKVRIEDGQQVNLTIGRNPEKVAAMQTQVKDSLMKVSKKLGGSLLFEEENVTAGGPLKVKIGGVKNRRGNAPYSVNFKAVVSGGSGKVKTIRWNFGDGESSTGKDAVHVFTQGVYIVVLQIEDENGQKATAQLNISVEENCAC